MTAFDHEAMLERQLRIKSKLLTLMICVSASALVLILLLLRDLNQSRASEERTNALYWELHHQHTQTLKRTK